METNVVPSQDGTTLSPMETELVIQNPHATMPLRIKMDVEVNVSRETILAHVRINSARIRQWVKSVPAHDGIAVIVGGGPSLRDTLDQVREMQSGGAKLFALNGAARFLADRGIAADYQIIMDAAPQTVQLVGPAKAHLFASQVDPDCFDLVPDAILWHASYGNELVDEQEDFPEAPGEYAIIGGGISVGNTSLALLWALGYRDFHIFGMDSSHCGSNTHAYQQEWNQGQIDTIYEFRGRKYVCSLPMKLQAIHFMERARYLEDHGGCKFAVHGSGLLPDIFNARFSEQEKYREIWKLQEYRKISPGEYAVDEFINEAMPVGSVIDFGCGTGRAGLRLHEAGLDVTLLDFADNSRDERAKSLPFVQHDLSKPIPIKADYGFCSDVMEHMPPELIDDVVRNIMQAAPVTFFQIATSPDDMGYIIGQRLHLSVYDHEWWRSKFAELGFIVRWEKERERCASFLVARKQQ